MVSEFPGGLVVKDLELSCCGMGYYCDSGSVPGLGTSTSHGCGQKKKKFRQSLNKASENITLALKVGKRVECPKEEVTDVGWCGKLY